MPNDIVVQSDKNGGKVHLSADRVYDLNKNKTQDVINAEFEPLMQLVSEVAIVIDGRSCTLGALSGQYVILQNSTITGKSDGLYTVAEGKTIPIGATNVTADMLSNPIPRGGLNSLSASVKAAVDLCIPTTAIALNAPVDLNDYWGPGKSGFYYVSNGVTNSKLDWSGLLVSGLGTAGFQLQWNGDGLYIRSRLGNPPEWGTWRSLQHKTDFTVTKNASNISQFTAYGSSKSGIAIVAGYLNPSAQIPNNTTLATCSKTFQMETFTSSVSNNGKLARFVLRQNGRIENEYPLEPSNWYSFTFVTLINE